MVLDASLLNTRQYKVRIKGKVEQISVMVIVVGNGHGNKSSIPRRDYISHCANTLEKGMNTIILPPDMSG